MLWPCWPDQLDDHRKAPGFLSHLSQFDQWLIMGFALYSPIALLIDFLLFSCLCPFWIMLSICLTTVLFFFFTYTLYPSITICIQCNLFDVFCNSFIMKIDPIVRSCYWNVFTVISSMRSLSNCWSAMGTKYASANLYSGNEKALRSQFRSMSVFYSKTLTLA